MSSSNKEGPPRLRPARLETRPPSPRRWSLPAPPPPAQLAGPVPRSLSASPPLRRRRILPEPPSAAEPPVLSAREPLSEIPSLVGGDPLVALFGTARLREAQPSPLLILARRPSDPRYEYLELLKRVLREAYRVTVRHPAAILHAGRRLTEYQLAMLRGGAGIYVVDADAVAESEAGGTALTRLVTALEDRLREVYAQPPGIVVLYGSPATLRRLRDLWRPRLVATTLYTRIPEPLEVSIPESDEAFAMVEAMYGLPGGTLSEAGSLDEAAVRAETMLWECIRGQASDPYLGRLVRQAVDDEEARPDDAPLHYGLKAVTVAHLLESGVRETSIETELVISNTPVDVFARRGWSGGIVAEAETLTGSMNPSSRLAGVAASRAALGYNVWLILSPLTASIYMYHVRSATRAYGVDGRVETYVLDPSNCLLAGFQQHAARLERVAERLLEKRLSR